MRRIREAHGRVVFVADVVELEGADVEDGGQRTSLDDPVGGLGYM